MCLAVGTMLIWHLWGVAVGETAVESQDHEHYQRVAVSRGEPSTVVHLYLSKGLSPKGVAMINALIGYAYVTPDATESLCFEHQPFPVCIIDLLSLNITIPLVSLQAPQN